MPLQPAAIEKAFSAQIAPILQFCTPLMRLHVRFQMISGRELPHARLAVAASPLQIPTLVPVICKRSGSSEDFPAITKDKIAGVLRGILRSSPWPTFT